MEIKDVKLTKDISGNKRFEVTTTDDETLFVPTDKANRHYQEIKEWYDAQKELPFKFKF